MFEEEFHRFLKEQRRLATGQRLEMLKRDLTGTKHLIQVALWPVLKSFEELELEHEMVSITGVRIFGDVYCRPIQTVFEHEGYVAHAENITRDRFSFEKMRVRTMMMHGYRFIPFSWDELDKKPEASRRAVYELLGRFGNASKYIGLTVMEREVIRCATLTNGPFRLHEICSWLQVGSDAGRRMLRKLLENKIIRPLHAHKKRIHAYVLEERAKSYLLYGREGP